ncbi:MAG: O-antigen ligase family protein [Candidatus Limnocylindria bacterium]
MSAGAPSLPAALPLPAVSPTQRRRGGRLLLAVACLAMAAVLGGAIAFAESPLPFLLGSVLLFAGGVLIANPRLSILLFLFIFYTNVPVVAMHFHGVPTVVAAMSPVLIGLPAVGYVLIRRQEVVLTRVFPLMIAFLGAQMLSSLLSADVRASAAWMGIYVAEGMLLFILVVNAIRTPEMVRWAIAVLLLAGTLMGGLSLFQEVTGTYENYYGGFAQSGEASDEEVVEEGLRPRLGGPIGSKNRYAQIMIVLLPLAAFAFLSTRSRWLRAATVVAGFLILTGMLLTFSRGAAVAFVGVVGLAVLMRHIRLKHALALTLVAAISVPLVAPEFVERLETLTGVAGLVSDSGEDPDGAILGRATSNVAALVTFFENPIVGVGPGRYFVEYSQDVANDLGMRHFGTSRRGHNLYAEMAADLGLLGLSLFLAIIVVTWVGLSRTRAYWRSRRAEYANWASAFQLSLAAYLMSGIFLHLSYARYLWLLVALANVTVWILAKERERAEAAEPAPERSPVTGSGALPSLAGAPAAGVTHRP